MEETVSSELNLSESSTLKFRHTINELQEQASSVLSLTLQWKDIEAHFNSTRSKIEERAKELRLVQESVDQKLQEVQGREKEYEEFVNVKFREIEERERELELIRKRDFEERREEIGKIEKSRKELEEVKELVEQRLREVKVIENERLREIDENEKQCQRSFNELVAKEKKLEEQRKQFELEDSKLRERITEFERKNKLLELKEKLFVRQCTHVKVDLSMDGASIAKDDAMDAATKICLSMDGIALQIFLNEHSEDLDSMEEQLFMALGRSSNPGKLVLDAMQGFYAPHLKKKGDGMEFEEAVARKSCIFLLEILMRLEPEISPDVEREATRLAFSWMERMKRDYQHSIEVLGCLLLLASYRLACAFDADELLTWLEIVAHYRQAPGLLRVLGLTDKISGFLQNLTRMDKKIEAITFIHAFELDDFPAIDILDEFLKDAMSALDKKTMKVKPIEGRIEATSKVIDNMKTALRCMEDCKIKSKLSTKHHLKDEIRRLEVANANRKAALSTSNCKSQLPCNKKICSTSKVASTAVSGLVSKCKTNISCLPTNLTSSPASTQSQKKNSNKRPWSAVSAEDDQNAIVGSASAVSSIQLPSQQPVESSKAEGFIRGCIKRNQRIEAIKNIYRLKMVDKFSPVSLLRDHMIYLKQVDQSDNSGGNGLSKQISFLSRKILQLQSVLDCVATYNIESEFSPKNLREDVARLETEMASKLWKFRSRAKKGPVTRSQSKAMQQQKEKQGKSSSCSSVAAPAGVPLKITHQSPNPSFAPASVAATVTVTSPAPDAALSSAPPVAVGASDPSTKVPSSSSPVIASTANYVTVTSSASSSGSAAPTSVNTPSLSTAPPSAMGSDSKKPKLETRNQQLPKEKKKFVSSGNSQKRSCAYLPPPAGCQFTYYYGAPYPSLSGYAPPNAHFTPPNAHITPPSNAHITPPSNAHFTPPNAHSNPPNAHFILPSNAYSTLYYGGVNPLHRWDARGPHNSVYTGPPPPS